MRYAVRHDTVLSYANPVADARFNLRLRPAQWPGQIVGAEKLTVSPLPARRGENNGPYLVNTTRIEFDGAVSRIEINSHFDVEVKRDENLGDGPPVAEVRNAAIAMKDLGMLAPAPYLFASRFAVTDGDIGEWAGSNFDQTAGIVAASSQLCSAVYEQFAYHPGSTTTSTPPRDAFERREGVCQDFAHIMIIGLRWLGIPAAYVSGYLRTVPPPGQEKLVGADAMHAWLNVWGGPELGWFGVDPTNDRLAGEDHVQIGMGRDYADCAPIDGTFIGAAPQSMTTAVDVSEVT